MFRDIDPVVAIVLLVAYWLVCSIITLLIMDPEAYDKDQALRTLMFAFGMGWLVVPCRFLCKIKII